MARMINQDGEYDEVPLAGEHSGRGLPTRIVVLIGVIALLAGFAVTIEGTRGVSALVERITGTHVSLY